MNIRLSSINTYELLYHNNPYTEYNEVALNPANDLGRLAADYLRTKFANYDDRLVAVRLNKKDLKDIYGRYLGTIFHNVPVGTSLSNVPSVLASFAASNPPIPWDSYLSDGRPYTLNWELVMIGYGNVDMRDTLWDSDWRSNALSEGSG